MDLILWLQSGERDRLVPQIMQIWVRRAWHLQHARASRPRVFAQRRVFLELLMPTTQQTTIAARTKCVSLDSLARLATYALPTLNFRWIPHSCTQTLFPCFGICDYFSFISLESAGGHTATKAMLQYCSEPFSVGYRSPGSMLTTRRQTHDEPCVQPASHDDPAHNPRLPTFFALDFCRPCITTSFLRAAHSL